MEIIISYRELINDKPAEIVTRTITKINGLFTNEHKNNFIIIEGSGKDEPLSPEQSEQVVESWWQFSALFVDESMKLLDKNIDCNINGLPLKEWKQHNKISVNTFYAEALLSLSNPLPSSTTNKRNPEDEDYDNKGEANIHNHKRRRLSKNVNNEIPKGIPPKNKTHSGETKMAVEVNYTDPANGESKNNRIEAVTKKKKRIAPKKKRNLFARCCNLVPLHLQVNQLNEKVVRQDISGTCTVLNDAKEVGKLQRIFTSFADKKAGLEHICSMNKCSCLGFGFRITAKLNESLTLGDIAQSFERLYLSHFETPSSTSTLFQLTFLTTQSLDNQSDARSSNIILALIPVDNSFDSYNRLENQFRGEANVGKWKKMGIANIVCLVPEPASSDRVMLPLALHADSNSSNKNNESKNIPIDTAINASAVSLPSDTSSVVVQQLAPTTSLYSRTSLYMSAATIPDTLPFDQYCDGCAFPVILDLTSNQWVMLDSNKRKQDVVRPMGIGFFWRNEWEQNHVHIAFTKVFCFVTNKKRPQHAVCDQKALILDTSSQEKKNSYILQLQDNDIKGFLKFAHDFLDESYRNKWIKQGIDLSKVFLNEQVFALEDQYQIMMKKHRNKKWKAKFLKLNETVGSQTGQNSKDSFRWGQIISSSNSDSLSNSNSSSVGLTPISVPASQQSQSSQPFNLFSQYHSHSHSQINSSSNSSLSSSMPSSSSASSMSNSDMDVGSFLANSSGSHVSDSFIDNQEVNSKSAPQILK